MKFDPSTHKPPLFDIFGVALRPGKTGSGLGIVKSSKVNTETGDVFLPPEWERPPPHATKSELEEARRKEWLVDPSFDLDGDGIVSPMDYFLAAQFDKDKDGKLNAEELAAAKSALAAGYKDKFHVVSGPANSLAHRVIQRRGKVLSEEIDGWHPLEGTFDDRETAPAWKRAPMANDSTAGEGGVKVAGAEYEHKTANKFVVTRSDLLRARKLKSINELRRVAGEPLPPGGVDYAGTGPPPPAETDDPFKPKAESTGVKSRQALLKGRKRKDMLSAMEKQGTAQFARPETPSETPRQQRETLAMTRSGLLATRADTFAQEAKKMAPTKPPGVHQHDLPISYAEKLGATRGWWEDKSHLEGVANRAEFDDIRGRGDERRAKEGPRKGKLAVESGTYRPYTPPDDVFKTRAMPTSEFLAQRAKKRLNGADKPFSRDAGAWAEIQAAKRGPEPQIKGGNAVVSPERLQEEREREEAAALQNKRSHTKRRWTDLVIDFRLRGEGAAVQLDEHGKLLEYDPKELEPLYSAFSRTHVFDPNASTTSSVRIATARSKVKQMAREKRKLAEAERRAYEAQGRKPPRVTYGMSARLPASAGEAAPRAEDHHYGVAGGGASTTFTSTGGGFGGVSPVVQGLGAVSYSPASSGGQGGFMVGGGGSGGVPADVAPRQQLARARSAVPASRSPMAGGGATPKAGIGRPVSAAGFGGRDAARGERQAVVSGPMPESLTMSLGRSAARPSTAGGVRSGGFQLLSLTSAGRRPESPSR